MGNGKGYSVFEMIPAFEMASGKKISYKIVDPRPSDVAVCYSNPVKARKVSDGLQRKGKTKCVSIPDTGRVIIQTDTKKV